MSPPRRCTPLRCGSTARTVRDLAFHPEDGDVIESIPADSDEGRAIIRHSTAHVMAQAVQDLFPDAKLGIGPPIANGFYYDFDVERPFTPEDVANIEKRMKAILKERQRFSPPRRQRGRGPRPSSPPSRTSSS